MNVTVRFYQIRDIHHDDALTLTEALTNRKQAQDRSTQAVQQSKPPRRAEANTAPPAWQTTKPGTERHRVLKSTGAGDGTRTRGYQLGKLGPYHLATPACVCAGRTSVSSSIPFHFSRDKAWGKNRYHPQTLLNGPSPQTANLWSRRKRVKAGHRAPIRRRARARSGPEGPSHL